MSRRLKGLVITLAFAFLLIVGIVSESSLYYKRYQDHLLFFGLNAENIMESGLDLDRYADYTKKELEDSGFSDVVVYVRGDSIYREKHTIFIEATPPATTWYRLFNRQMESIWIKHKFRNTNEVIET